MSFEELHEDCSRRFQKKEEREGLPEKPGVHEILEYLKENEVPVALASSTRKAAVMEHLNRAGITGYFQKIVCGDMVDHGKPAPDIYVKACEEMGVKPSRQWRWKILLMESGLRMLRDYLRSWCRTNCHLQKRFLP